MNTDKVNTDKVVCRLLWGNFHDMLEALQEEYDSVCKDKEGLLNVIDTWNKDAELQKLRDEVDYYRRHSLCQLSDKEMAAIKKFKNEHYKLCKNAGTYRHELSGTGIGTAIKIICPCCEAEENVTDYDTW